MATLLDEVKGDPDNEYSKEIITCEWLIMLYGTFSTQIIIVAIKRKYEAERRALKESDKGETFKRDRTKKAKYDQRKKRVFLIILIPMYY